MISVNLYRCSCDPHTVDKSLYVEDSTTCSGTIRGDLHVQHPVIDIEGDGSMYNYAEINGRYYHVDSCNRVRTGICSLSLSVDVLWTYMDAIYALPAVVDRSYRMVNAYLPDDRQRTRQYTQCVNKPIGADPIDGQSFRYTAAGHLLLTVG